MSEAEMNSSRNTVTSVDSPEKENSSRTNVTPPDEYDTPWKEIASRFFPQLVQFFAYDLYKMIDWSAGYEFLEQELREMLRGKKSGPRRVDKVVKVYLLSGEPRYLVLHVEIQVSRESGFPRRMFRYYIRLYDLYPESVVSLAILGDEEPGWKPKRYKHKQHGTGVAFVYRTIKLWEYNKRWAELERDPNPFALVVMAHLRTKTTRGKAQRRLQWKVELVRQLYGRGYSREDVLALFRLIDWLLALPKGMDGTFRERVSELEEEKKMRYVTSIERMSREEGHEKGHEEGHKEGHKEGAREVLLSLIEENYGPPDDSIRKLAEQASTEQILKWARKMLRASSLDEVFAT